MDLVIGIILALVAFVALGVCKDGTGYKWKKNKKQFLSIFALVVILFGCTASVPTGHTGVVTTFGKVENFTLEAGFHFKLPWQEVVKMDNRTQKAAVDLTCFSSDIQEVTMKYSININRSARSMSPMSRSKYSSPMGKYCAAVSVYSGYWALAREWT